MAADFTVTTTVEGILSGNTYSVTNTATISGVTNVINRTVTIPTSQVDILTIGATVGAGGVTSLNTMLIVNKDSTNFIRVRLEDTGGATSDQKVEAGRAILINNDDLSVSETGAAFAAFSDIDTVAIEADTADCIVEFITLEV